VKPIVKDNTSRTIKKLLPLFPSPPRHFRYTLLQNDKEIVKVSMETYASRDGMRLSPIEG
jgi:hypothetical protein